MRAISNIDHPLPAQGRLRLMHSLQKKNLSTFIFVEIFFMAGMHAPAQGDSRSATLTFSFLLARALGEAKARAFLDEPSE